MNCLNRKQKERKRPDKLFEKGRTFLKNIKPDEKVALIYHKDVDGICSGTLVKTGLEMLGIKVQQQVPASYRTLEETIRKMKFDKLIVVDIGISSKYVNLFTTPTLIIDHHMVFRQLKGSTGKNIVYINPRLTKSEIYQPVSYVVYNLLSGITNIRDKEWLAVLGIAGDYAFDDCKDLLGRWVDLKSIKTKDDFLDKTKFGKIVFTLVGALFELRFEKIMNILFTAKGLDDVLENEEIRAAHKKYEKLYEKEKLNFWKNSETVGKIIFSTLKPVHEGMGSSIVNEISRQNPEKIILLFEDLGDKYDIDARQQGNIHLGKLMKKTCNGGGHKNAAGGLIKKGELEDFKRRVLKELNMT